MLLPLLLSAGLAGAQAAPVEVTTPRLAQGPFFLSPMGEPFYGRKPGEDGLLVWFEQADRDHDGAITADEMMADAERFFAVLDRQHDGEIDPDDMDYYEGVIAPQARANPIVTVTDNPGGGQTVHVDNETSSGLYSLLKIPQPVASADTNLNRGVSLTEFQAAARRRFHLLDSAATGRLTLAQLVDLRRAAIAAAKRRPNPGDDTSDPHSAEFGRSTTP